MHHPTTKDRLSSLLNQLFTIADLAISQFITTTKEYACRSIDFFSQIPWSASSLSWSSRPGLTTFPQSSNVLM